MPFEKGAFGVVRDPGNPKYEESRLKGFRVRWAVASSYEIREGMLAPKSGANWRDYYPINHATLPIQLAKIEAGDTNALLAFARKYGDLGFRNLLPFGVGSIFSRKLFSAKELLKSKGFAPGTAEKERAIRAREHVENERKRLDNLSRLCGLPDMSMWGAWIKSGGGDPLPWLWAHVRTLKLCIDLGLYIEDLDEEGLEAFLRKHVQTADARLKILQPTLDVAFQHTVTPYCWSQPKDLTLIEFGKYLRREIINENIRSIRIAIQPDGNEERSFFVSRSLIEIAYWHLHNHAIAGSIKRCKREGCGGFFVQTHGRTDYCPEPKTPKGESRCAVLDRSKRAMKKYREKLRRKRKPAK
ncbi:MAG: hypothetical protein ABL960_05785 [Nitrospira sp.]